MQSSAQKVIGIIVFSVMNETIRKQKIARKCAETRLIDDFILRSEHLESSDWNLYPWQDKYKQGGGSQ